MERYDIRVNVWGDVSGPQYEWETVKAEDGDFVLYADAQATVDRAKAEGATEVRKVIQQRLIDVRLSRSVTRLSFAKDDCDAQIEVLESVLKQCEKPFSSNNENGLDLQATVEALQRERDHAKKMEAVQKEVADNQTWHVRELRAVLDAEREKVRTVEHELARIVKRNQGGYIGDRIAIDKCLTIIRTLDATTPEECTNHFTDGSKIFPSRNCCSKGGDGE